MKATHIIRTEEESLADDSDPGPESDPESDAANSQDSDTALLKLTTRKPAFRSAPRFKPAEPPDEAHAHPDPYLADIFSPQRRGAKYFPGGLAAELRDWLVEAKGGVDGKGEAQATS
ncbi:0e546d90-256e-4766-9347-bbb976b05f11 [Thermothielavioides terrestris]|uniref:0e546d90-256e-4766-9347-bbb976b05f11 n=1 Tax=Thermothielavioides terrestris TaxID=2587410 RepID=A0A3S5CWH7_9PEZI|nr:0e546d90-256e-4766-9347-bbb976b05f11 [Thermothielavioides terrestris]